MKVKFFQPNRVKTEHVSLNTSNCKSCWKCVNKCSEGVIGKVNFLGHSHAIFKKPENCTGCLKCLKECETNAITKNSEMIKKNKPQPQKKSTNVLVNFGLLFVGFLMIASGLILQFKYHLQHSLTSENFLFLDYFGWSFLHKASITVFSVLIAYHVISHFKWYKVVITKKLISKNMQVISLTIIFLIAAITGYIAWILSLNNEIFTVRKLFVEIHDKIALVLTIYIFLHIFKRIKWYLKTVNKL